MPSEMVKADQQSVLEVRQQVNQIQYLMKDVLQDGEHYGCVPGCGKKPTLLQPGAEKIAYMFHFVPTYEVTRNDLGAGHREYEVRCTLTNRDTGEVVGGGLGLCTTMESKYRYRNKWVNNQKVREENPDIADTLNTVLKMAKKRAFVDAVKSTTAASDIFTQDIEDMGFAAPQAAPAAQPKSSPAKEAWKKVATLKDRAIGLGIKEQGLNDWMSSAFAGRDLKTLTEDEVNYVAEYIQGRINDMQSISPEPIVVEAEVVTEEEAQAYYDEDVPF